MTKRVAEGLFLEYSAVTPGRCERSSVTPDRCHHARVSAYAAAILARGRARPMAHSASSHQAAAATVVAAAEDGHAHVAK